MNKIWKKYWQSGEANSLEPYQTQSTLHLVWFQAAWKVQQKKVWIILLSLYYNNYNTMMTYYIVCNIIIICCGTLRFFMKSTLGIHMRSKHKKARWQRDAFIVQITIVINYIEEWPFVVKKGCDNKKKLTRKQYVPCYI